MHYILGTICKASLSWNIYGYKIVETNGGCRDGRHDEYGPLADQYLDRDIKLLEQKGSDRLGYTIVCMFFCFIPLLLLLFRSCSQIFFVCVKWESQA